MDNDFSWMDWSLLLAREARHITTATYVWFSALQQQWLKMAGLYRHDTLCVTVEKAMRNHDAEKVNIIGHSLGGLEALAYTLKNPDKVDTCVSVASPFTGTSMAKFGHSMLALGVYAPVLDQILPGSDYLQELQRRLNRTLPELERNGVKIINIYSPMDELIANGTGSLEAVMDRSSPIVYEHMLKHGHAQIFHCDFTYNIALNVIDNPNPTILLHGMLMNKQFFDDFIEAVPKEDRKKVYVPSYDYTLKLHLD